MRKREFTAKNLERMFPDDNACLEWLVSQRYPNGIECPVCKKVTKHHKYKSRYVYACDQCGHHVSPLASTIFHKSPTPLKIWFDAIHEIATTRTGFSAKAFQRKHEVTYKTAWRIFKQVRKLLNETPIILDNEVEVDETYVGGKAHGKRGRGAENKTAVIGIAQRRGRIVTKVVADVKRSTVMPFIARNVAQRAIVYTDEYHVYDTVDRLGMRHESVNHADKVYANGRVHTNTIESFWSLTKRGISGVYHAVSPKYLQSYLNEYAFRHNHRKDETPMFVLMLNRIVASL
ncbi:MAG: IS1595 family transposase [Chloroflexi bacterium]|nr:IS1595 family transposase [Chloroflexota bacterium]